MAGTSLLAQSPRAKNSSPWETYLAGIDAAGAVTTDRLEAPILASGMYSLTNWKPLAQGVQSGGSFIDLERAQAAVESLSGNLVAQAVEMQSLAFETLVRGLTQFGFLREVQTATTKAEVMFINTGRRLADRIRALKMPEDAEAEETETAANAIAEASVYVAANLPVADPFLSLTDDGVVMLRWQYANDGLLLVFAGDGQVNYSIRPAGSQFAHTAKTIPITAQLPSQFSEALAKMEDPAAS